jgi:hypothetical protein
LRLNVDLYRFLSGCPGNTVFFYRLYVLEIKLLRGEGWDPINRDTCLFLSKLVHGFRMSSVVGFTTNYAVSAYDP